MEWLDRIVYDLPPWARRARFDQALRWSVPIAAGCTLALLAHGIPAVVFGLDTYDAVFLGVLIAMIAWVPCGILAGALALRAFRRISFRQGFIVAFTSAALAHGVYIGRTSVVIDDDARTAAFQMLSELGDRDSDPAGVEFDAWLVDHWVVVAAIVGLASSLLTGVGGMLGVLLAYRADVLTR